MPNCYVIAGPNGAGKTTTAFTVLPHLHWQHYVNADEIARGLSPFNPELVNFQAGRLMLKRIRELAESQENFAFETTLASRSFVPFLNNLQEHTYRIHLTYVALNSPDLAVARVKKRVASGGHNIPEADIRRRFKNSKQNLVELYLPLVDSWDIYDNSDEPIKVAEGNQFEAIIYNEESWNYITQGLST